METIPANSELNWKFVEPLNEKALNGLEDQLKMGLSDAFKDFIRRSNYGFSQWRSFVVGNKSYTFKHVLNFNLESKGLFIDFMQSLMAQSLFEAKAITISQLPLALNSGAFL